MRAQSGLDRQTELRTPPRARFSRANFPPEAPGARAVAAEPELSIAELAFRVRVAFRVHPHLSNVLTHISPVPIGPTLSNRSTPFSMWRRKAAAFHPLSKTSSI